MTGWHDPAFTAPGRFWKGNLHTHSTRSDGARDPEAVCAAYREAGYDFLALTDHFIKKYGFPIVDTAPFRTNAFTTIFGAEVHAPATRLGEPWHILAVGLPLDLAPTGDDESMAALTRRCLDAGAFVAIAHPAWYALSFADVDTLPSVHAVEIYNHTCQVRTDRGDGTYLVDQMLAAGRRPLVCATDDAHFHCVDYFGGFVRVKAEENAPEALLAALKAGRYYSSQGPEITEVTFDGAAVEVATAAPVSAIMALGRASKAAQVVAEGTTRARLDLSALVDGGFTRIVLADAAGRRAWTNPVWRTA
jgi:histidinol phosphatase-like PHP family hydrolase